jgi:excisionase family DNA binding protein
LTVQEVAKELGIHEATVRHWIKRGALEAIVLPHPGKREVYRIRRSALKQAHKLLDFSM